MMSEESPIQIPNAMRWRFKTIRKLLKETVPMTPNNGTTSVKPGQRIIVDLPFNSTVDLSTFTWFLKVKQVILVQVTQALMVFLLLYFFLEIQAL